MKRKRRLRQCDSKQKFYTEADAVAALHALRKIRPFARMYRCRGRKGQQRHWHLTSGGRS